MEQQAGGLKFQTSKNTVTEEEEYRPLSWAGKEKGKGVSKETTAGHSSLWLY